MDRICGSVLNKINSLASLGRYVIISEDEFYESFPEDADRSDSELKRAIRFLLSGGFIDVKYSGGNMYCVAPLKKYLPEPEEILPAPVKAAETPAKTRNGLLTFLSAFFGGAAGSLIISLIFYLLNA